MINLTVSMPTLLATLGVVLVIIEIVVLGFSTVFLIFAAIGCFVTSLLMYLGLLNHQPLTATLSVAIISLISAALLWKPLKRMQTTHSPAGEQPNVFSDVTFKLPEALDKDNSVSFSYSGISWQVFLDDSETALAKGVEVQVVKTGVGKMWVKSVGPCS